MCIVIIIKDDDNDYHENVGELIIYVKRECESIRLWFLYAKTEITFAQNESQMFT